MCGLPYSGKSTLARLLQDYTGVHIIRLDALNAARGNNSSAGTSIDEWGKTYAETKQRTRAHLAAGESVVIEWVNPRQRHREWWHELADEFGATFRVLYLDIDWAESIDAASRRSVGATISRWTTLSSPGSAAASRSRTTSSPSSTARRPTLDGGSKLNSPDSSPPIRSGESTR